MIGYAMVGTADMEKAKAFYTPLLAEMGAKIVMDIGRAAFYGVAQGQPMFAVCVPYDKQAPNPGNGNMVALPGGSREGVDALYAKAIELGATSEGEPGERMPGFYGAYFRDHDGNKLAFFHMG
ncbi:VOC family protein [Pseudomonas sp. MIL19]|uniref:VOC family protein n=1 Tax=Pseudomonas sp. MIL19 TaxID=2976979 RepID=UPI001D9559A9|nr:VOC family protein [Pseudomonas sp. MIL19]MBU0808144.1 VOC family protein [Gammaproteobacteria bacterium]MBU0884198.1 VOC family protein [Gammaproteobacteria bacterium]MBU1860437.1 VOC family protein [Gammaproteobacteria bacterium]MDD2160964.1 VOC family protein [Pseudomonas sp. MIL19]